MKNYTEKPLNKKNIDLSDPLWKNIEQTSGCTGKHPFKDKTVAKKVMKEQQRRSTKAQLCVYKCDFCSNYHIGSHSHHKSYK